MSDDPKKPVKYQSVSWACDLCKKSEVIELSPRCVTAKQITAAALECHRETSPECRGNYADMTPMVKFRDTMGHFKIIHAQPITIASLEKRVAEEAEQQGRKPVLFFPGHMPKRGRRG